jgi:S-adenosylmethionine:tRNA ribosyltransferase-isomerase
MSLIDELRISEYGYELPEDRIARYPLRERDLSKLLIYRGGEISEARFRDLPDHLPVGALLVFNNTRVIRARMLFRKETGSLIEIFCLEPVVPSDYGLVFGQTDHCTWSCLIGNRKRWKGGLLHRTVDREGCSITLTASLVGKTTDTQLVAFTWEPSALSFAEILDIFGMLPLPPYLHRAAEESDLRTYQTVYSKIQGSVAAPTAGLHFTDALLKTLDAGGFMREEVTLHVGAGTFKPVKTPTIGGHEMHVEHFEVSRRTLENLLLHLDSVIAIGTTSVRVLESLYYIGVMLSNRPDAPPEELQIGQWMSYNTDFQRITPDKSLKNVLNYLRNRDLDRLTSSTRILIMPGYQYNIVRGMLTNFHLPQSTLLLLVSAFVGGDWHRIYDYALSHDFRFLSYGDSSLLL